MRAFFMLRQIRLTTSVGASNCGQDLKQLKLFKKSLSSVSVHGYDKLADIHPYPLSRLIIDKLTIR